MNSNGYTKNIDDLGRIVLPKEIRKKLDMDIRTSVELVIDGDKIVITKAQKECVFCSSKDNLTEFKNKTVCSKCISEIK